MYWLEFMRSVDVCVVGGGFSGLYLSSMIDGDVHIFEEHSNIGLPMHCAGIISPKTFNMLGVSKKFIEAEYDGFVICFNGYKLYWLGKPLALKVDRVGIEQYFYDRCLSKGHSIHLDSFVSFIDVNGLLKVDDDRRFKSNLIILAEGSKRFFSRRLGLINYSDDFLGFQAYVHCRVHSNYIHVYIDGLSDYFSWFIPIGDDKCIIGLTVRNSVDVITLMRLLLKHVMDEGLISNASIKRFFSGIVIRGPIGSYGLGRILAIGDAIQMNKPLTGGGLYPICLFSRVLSTLINSYLKGSLNFNSFNSLYSNLFWSLSNKFKFSFRLVRILLKFNNFAFKSLIKGGCRLKFDNSLLSHLDYDEHFIDVVNNPLRLLRFGLAFMIGLFP
ncbi:MAG: NAD(P)/FAD-dependent oxidoreductase [Candidatus Methanomethylicia archaeon]